MNIRIIYLNEYRNSKFISMNIRIIHLNEYRN
ncbi:unnamed protein product, partial [Rotaria magnacalcarata]